MPRRRKSAAPLSPQHFGMKMAEPMLPPASASRMQPSALDTYNQYAPQPQTLSAADIIADRAQQARMAPKEESLTSEVLGGLRAAGSGLNNARLAAGNAIGDMVGSMSGGGPEAWGGAPAMGPGSLASKVETLPNVTGSSGGTKNIPWKTIGAAGLGGAGLLGLYYLMQQRKKKKEEEEGRMALKAAKVYEAAESVDGMKPKEVYESHKKCAPGEFNMHKEGGNSVKRSAEKMAFKNTLEGLRGGLTEFGPRMMPLATTAGLLGGALYGSSSGEGMARGALRGGLIGTGAALGAGAGGGGGTGAALDIQKKPNTMEGAFDRAGNAVYYGGMPGFAAGGVGGGVAGNELFKLLERGMAKKEQPSDKKDKAEKQSSARQFGEKFAAGFDWKSIMNTGLGGAALGAGVGGLAGLIAPGEEADGKRRGRLSGALRGALGGGLLGGGAGAVGEAASPGFGQSAYNYAGDLYRQLFGRKGLPTAPGPQPEIADTVDGRVDLNNQKNIPFTRRPNMGATNTGAPTSTDYAALDEMGM
jgi:hypothetical protein